jgi:hypothetical protein
MKWIREIFSDSNGDPSSKRVGGFILLISAIVMAFFQVVDNNVCITAMGIAAGLLSGDSITEIWKK